MNERDRDPLWALLAHFDVIEDPPGAWADLAEAILLARSSLELLREALTASERDLLDQVDAYWLAHPAEFDRTFATVHASAAVAGGVGGSFWWLRPLGLVREVERCA